MFACKEVQENWEGVGKNTREEMQTKDVGGYWVLIMMIIF